MPQFSANLGFLWSELSLPDAIRAAHQAGFDAVECHWPFETATGAVTQALQETGLPMLGLNTRRGDTNGLCAVPGQEMAARAAIDEAIAYAQAINAKSVHLMAGVATGPAAEESFLKALTYAVEQAPADMMLLIEPLNPFDAPGYFLRDTRQACSILAQLEHPNLRLMFDCYHVARTEGDVLSRLQETRQSIGHIQFAGVPDRGAPDVGSLDYGPIFAHLDDTGWDKPLGAEYKPGGPTERSLGWMPPAR